MAESTKDADKRTSKRSKMRQSLDSAFGDPLQNFKTSVAVRKISETIDNESAKLEDRIRKISDSSDEPIGDDPDKTSLYINQRQELVEDLGMHIKEARKIVREARTELSSGHQKNELKKALTELNETDSILLKERTALAANRIRVKYGVLGRPSHVKIGQAYMMAITENFPEPAESSYKKQHGKSGTDQTSFRNRVIKAYNTEGSKILETPLLFTNKIWCPVSGKEFEALAMKAAHIIPHSIGETNAAYLFGSKLDEGYDVIWSERNGFMLHNVFEKIFDDGRMIIIPDPTDDNEFINIILSQDLLKDSRLCPAINAPYSTIHKRRLQFQTAARPGTCYLYMHALLSLFRRRRYDMPGWEKDREQVFNGQIREKWARKSMVEALALEIGDSWEDIEAVGGLGEFPDAKSPEEEKRVATVVRYTLQTRASDMEDEDDE
jgi:HNH endonuclease